MRNTLLHLCNEPITIEALGIKHACGDYLNNYFIMCHRTSGSLDCVNE